VITLRRLRLVGISENYEVSFCDEEGAPRPLAIIAGEISTGKTAVLEFVDYCLGKNRHPSYVEIRRQARSAQLELDLSGETHVIERPLFSSENAAWLHECSLTTFSKPHATRKLKVDPAGDSSTLNWLLLSHSGLEGVQLKEAPTKAESGTDPLSFRDVMWLAFLDSDRLLARHLLHESGAPMKRLKLRQLIEVIFGVHDQELATMGDRIALLKSERETKKAEIFSLESFLAEQEVGEALDIRAEIESSEQAIEPLQARLTEVGQQMRASSDYADLQRQRFGDLRAKASQAASRVRDRESLLSRLLPLHAQYVEDEGKLVFLSEARQLFDPIGVRVCPACLQDLERTPEIEDGRCSLCHSPLLADEEPIDVEAERAAIRARIRAITAYIEQVQAELGSERIEYERISGEESIAQAEVDSDISAELAPFVAERDQLVRQIATGRARTADLERRLNWIQGIERRNGELSQLQSRLDDLRTQQRAMEENRPDRNVVVSELTVRYARLLKAFGFPKLDDPEPPRLDNEFVPYVRGVRYDKIGSRGAVTLVALAWTLAIFELALETGRPHPGFLMIDSPQSNLRPLDEREFDEFSTEEIGARLWHHLSEWSQGPGREAQLIVVDHRPPPEVWGSIVVSFSGRAERPPYGLIANETDGPAASETRTTA
jgi:hypothetical protein